MGRDVECIHIWYIDCKSSDVLVDSEDGDKLRVRKGRICQLRHNPRDATALRHTQDSLPQQQTDDAVLRCHDNGISTLSTSSFDWTVDVYIVAVIDLEGLKREIMLCHNREFSIVVLFYTAEKD